MEFEGDILERYAQGQRFLFLAEQCLNLTKKSLSSILRQFKLNHSQYLILMILNYADSTGQQVISTELSYLLGREKNSITPLVESLVKEGCVTRGANPEDRRVITLTLTAKGRALIKKVQPLTVPTIADIPFGTQKGTDTFFGFLEHFRRSFAEKSGQDPNLYSGAFANLLVEGENRLIENTAGKSRRGG
ncbi:MAG: MarR family transcriptional regulator [Spirochaetota bacterium]